MKKKSSGLFEAGEVKRDTSVNHTCLPCTKVQTCNLLGVTTSAHAKGTNQHRNVSQPTNKNNELSKNFLTKSEKKDSREKSQLHVCYLLIKCVHSFRLSDKWPHLCFFCFFKGFCNIQLFFYFELPGNPTLRLRGSSLCQLSQHFITPRTDHIVTVWGKKLSILHTLATEDSDRRAVKARTY